MTERVQQELALLREVYPELEWRADVFWARLEQYSVPADLWSQDVVEIAFQIPQHVGAQPYGFWVRPILQLKSGDQVKNYSFPVTTPFGDGWGQFSWAPAQWQPAAVIRDGTNMLHFVRSFADRLKEGA
jgi:8-oxo-dGTP pyrophosphatase MutT (NUDIX family)